MTRVQLQSRGTRHRRGFTLLELILAMAITCMLAMTLYATLRTGFRAQASATQAVEALRSAQVAMQMVGKDLSCAMPPTGVLAGAFYGMPMGTGGGMGSGGTTSGGASAGPSQGADLSDTVEFYAITGGVSDPNDPVKADGVKRIDFTIAMEPDGTRCLVRRVQGNLTSLEEYQPQEEIVCRNVAGFTCRYFDGVQWEDSWDSTAEQDTLPVAVEVTIELAPSGRSQRGYRMTRVFNLPCTVPANLTGGAL